jgi:hypothetical protein
MGQCHELVELGKHMERREDSKLVLSHFQRHLNIPVLFKWRKTNDFFLADTFLCYLVSYHCIKFTDHILLTLIQFSETNIN